MDAARANFIESRRRQIASDLDKAASLIERAYTLNDSDREDDWLWADRLTARALKLRARAEKWAKELEAAAS